MKAALALNVFVDACGWEILKADPFCRDLAPHRRRLNSVFGYSSACVPSILSGRWPAEHRNWCYFVYDPYHSPFSFLQPLRHLPRAVTSRRIFRRWLTKLVKARLGFRGYFDLYNIPFRHISLFDFTEKKSPLKAGGMNRGENIVDVLQQRGIPAHISDPEAGEERNWATLREELERGRIDFAFLYWAGLDGLMHRVGNHSPEIGGQLRSYERWIRLLFESARSHYRDVRLNIFSDHGMANCDHLLDLQARIQSLGLVFGRDYVVVYDSTMARFWFFNDKARQRVTERLKTVEEGRIIPEAELRELGAYFPDHYFGELIFLVREGVLIVPSHMGERPLRGMHGYHPAEKHSFASLLSNQEEIPAEIQAIPDLFRLMVRDAEWANARNHATASLSTKPRLPSAATNSH